LLLRNQSHNENLFNATVADCKKCKLSEPLQAPLHPAIQNGEENYTPSALTTEGASESKEVWGQIPPR
jgi:hypothetical protein